jgi:cyclic-di-GMP-binding protein
MVSKITPQEADNALNRAAKEVSTRFDFRGVGASLDWSGRQGRGNQGNR